MTRSTSGRRLGPRYPAQSAGPAHRARAEAMLVAVFAVMSTAGPVLAFSQTVSITDPASRTRAAFLTAGAGVRSTGMGEAFTAVADDASAVSWNPGGLAQLGAFSGVAQYDAVGLGAGLSYAAAALPAGPGVLAAGLTLLTYGSLDGRDGNGVNIATASFTDVAGAASYGVAHPSGFPIPGSTGVGVEVVHEGAGDTLLALSAGSVIPISSWIRAGWAVEHLGPGKDGTSLPGLAKVGVRTDLKRSFVVAADGGWLLTAREPWVSVGGELMVHPRIALRAGYKWRPDHRELAGLDGLAVGAGYALPFAWQNGTLRLDYAYEPLGDILAGHRFGLSYAFGSAREVERGRPAATSPYSAGEIRSVVKDWVAANQGANGVLYLVDGRSGSEWFLEPLSLDGEVFQNADGSFLAAATFLDSSAPRELHRTVEVYFTVKAGADTRLAVAQGSVHWVAGRTLFQYRKGVLTPVE